MARFARIVVEGSERPEARRFVKLAMQEVAQTEVYSSSEAGSPHAAGGICRCSPSRWTRFKRFRVCTMFRAGDLSSECIVVASV